MDEETRRFIREAEWEKMRARESRVQIQEQQQIDAQRVHEKRMAYVMRYGREKAASRTVMKWTIGFLTLAVLSFPQTLKTDGIGQALLNLVIIPLVGAGIGLYRASHLPYEN